MALSGVRTGATVLDLGAGTALIARAAAAAAAETGRVVSCDDVDVLLAESPRAPVPGLAPVMRVATRSRLLPVRTAAFDNVLLVGVRWALSDVAGEIQRVTRVGGRVVVRAAGAEVRAAADLLVSLGFELVHLSDAHGRAAASCHLVVRRAA